MKLKRLTALLLSVMIVLSLAACGGGGDTKDDSASGDLSVFNHVLTRTDVRALNMAANREHNFTPTGIVAPIANRRATADPKVYNLQGQCVGLSLSGLRPGVYVQNGKKYVVK